MRVEYGKESCIPLYFQSVDKLIIDIDGNSISHTFPKALATGSAVLKISVFLEIGMVLAKPWTHFIPVKMDLSDLEEKINWARNNDKELEKIGNRGKELSEKKLTLESYKCYTVRLLRKYKSLFVSEE